MIYLPHNRRPSLYPPEVYRRLFAAPPRPAPAPVWALGSLFVASATVVFLTLCWVA